MDQTPESRGAGGAREAGEGFIKSTSMSRLTDRNERVPPLTRPPGTPKHRSVSRFLVVWVRGNKKTLPGSKHSRADPGRV